MEMERKLEVTDTEEPLEDCSGEGVSCVHRSVRQFDNIMTFLDVFRPLECQCHCCDGLLGFQHKRTGVIYCVNTALQVFDREKAEQISRNEDEISLPAEDVVDVSLPTENAVKVSLPTEKVKKVSFLLENAEELEEVEDNTGLDILPQPESVTVNENYTDEKIDEYYMPPVPDLTSDKTVNQTEPIVIVPEAAVERGWTPLTPIEKKEMADLCSTNSYLRETLKLIEESMQELISPGEEIYKYYVFRLDNAELQEDWTYRIADVPLLSLASLQGEMDFEIMSYITLSEVIVRPTAEEFRKKKKQISLDIEEWMNSRSKKQLERLRPQQIPVQDEMCIVQWPRYWQEVTNIMEDIYGSDDETWFKENMEDPSPRLSIFHKDYTTYAGKWFRAACVRPYQKGRNAMIYEMFLIDLGITTLIPANCVYKMPHRFMLSPQLSLYFNIKLEGITQYSKKIDEKWKNLLLPKMRIKAKVLWKFDEVVIVRLIEPSESEFDEHFRRPSVLTAIQERKEKIRDNQRYRKVKKMSSSIKGSFPKNMEKVLEQEAAEEELKRSRKEYVGIGRIHPDRVFDLALPRPMSLEEVEYRNTNRETNYTEDD